MATEAEFGVEFWEKGKHVITLSQKARSALDAWDYAEGRLCDMSLLETQEGRPPYTFDEVRIISPERYKETIRQQMEGK